MLELKKNVKTLQVKRETSLFERVPPIETKVWQLDIPNIDSIDCLNNLKNLYVDE